jgi:hypothetical protein
LSFLRKVNLYRLIRMTDAKNPAAQALAMRRWSPSPLVQRAAETVIDRWSELDEQHREALRDRAERDGDGGEAA